MNPVTKEIVNRYCQKVFHLDEYEDYFIKTGTYSSKYEFRNAHIHNPKEINEMGEYFLFLNHLTCLMAGSLNSRCCYGANTTNEWVVREYIKDKENNPTITTVCRCTLNIACLWILIQRKFLAQVLIGAAML